MKHSNNHAHTILGTVVPEDQRLNFLPRHFGTHMMLVERQVYHHFANLCPQYQGGYWHFYELSNGGCYLAPDRDRCTLSHAGNSVDATVSGDAAGIIATLYTFSHLAFHFEHDPYSERLSTHFHLLRAYASQHAEGGLIYRVID